MLTGSSLRPDASARRAMRPVIERQRACGSRQRSVSVFPPDLAPGIRSRVSLRNSTSSKAGTTPTLALPRGMDSDRPSRAYDRVGERRRAVALARHFRESEGLSIAQIADRIGRSPTTIKAYFYDPTGEKARAVKARYVGLCRGCGAYTQPRNGKGDAYAYCKACHPGAIEPKWTRAHVLAAMWEWLDRYNRLPSSYDCSRTHARRRRGEAPKRLGEGEWPSASVVAARFGSWAAARAAMSHRDEATVSAMAGNGLDRAAAQGPENVNPRDAPISLAFVRGPHSRRADAADRAR